jgi:DNA-binding MurR/RpiR family transcriptional regulator
MRSSRIVICTGVGKSDDVARLVTSLLQSVRVPAVHISVVDMGHGGFNLLRRKEESRAAGRSTVIAFSHSGATAEIVNMLYTADQYDVHRVMVTGADHVVGNVYVDELVRYHIHRDGSKHGTIPIMSCAEQIRAIGAHIEEVADRLTIEELHAGHPRGALGTTYAKRITPR